MKKSIALLLLTFFSVAAHADIGQQAKVIGDWTIYKKVDIMTDKTQCIALFGGNKNIQLNEAGLAFGKLGYPQAYKYRLDDEPLSQLVLNEDVPKQMGAVILEGTLFERIKGSKRFRIQVTATPLQTFDLNTSAANTVLAEFKKQGCTGS